MTLLCHVHTASPSTNNAAFSAPKAKIHVLYNAFGGDGSCIHEVTKATREIRAGKTRQKRSFQHRFRWRYLREP